MTATALPREGARPPRLPNRGFHAYVAGMAIFPRPVSPKNAIADLLDMFSPDRPHRWTFLALAATVTGIMLWGFAIDSRPPPRQREIIYVESWMADRKDSDIIKRQLEDLDKYEAALVKKQNEFQKLADNLGIEWRDEEERSRKQRHETIAAMKTYLQKKLAAALAKEGKTATAQAAPPPAAQTPTAQ